MLVDNHSVVRDGSLQGVSADAQGFAELGNIRGNAAAVTLVFQLDLTQQNHTGNASKEILLLLR